MASANPGPWVGLPEAPDFGDQLVVRFDTAAVPGPIASAGLPGLILVACLAGGDGGRRSPEHFAPTSRCAAAAANRRPAVSALGQPGH